MRREIKIGRTRRGLILKSAVVVILLAIAPILQGQTTNGDINLSRLADAIKAINGDELPHAERLLNSVLAALPEDPDALNLLGVIRAKQNRPAEAERLFRRALARSPTHISAHNNLSELLLTTNRSPEAMVILLRAHKLEPKPSRDQLETCQPVSGEKQLSPGS